MEEAGSLAYLLSLPTSHLRPNNFESWEHENWGKRERGKALINNQEKRKRGKRSPKEQLSWTGAQSWKVGTLWDCF